MCTRTAECVTKEWVEQTLFSVFFNNSNHSNINVATRRNVFNTYIFEISVINNMLKSVVPWLQ